MIFFVAVNQSSLLKLFDSAVDDFVKDLFELRNTQSFGDVKCRWLVLVIKLIDAIKEQLMKVDVEIDGPTESLNQGHGSGLGLCFF